MKVKLLISCGAYLPGMKAGGPIRSLSNLVDAIGDELEIFIITSDRDLGDNRPYGNISVNENNIGKAKVYYIKPNIFSSIFNLLRIYILIKPDTLYLNSFFNLKFTIIPLFLKKIGFFKNTKVVIAPRGEFGCGALSLKSCKKEIFIKISKVIGLYNNLAWHSTSEEEVKDIHKVIGGKSITYIPNIPLSVKKINYIPVEKKIRIVFVGRISKMKNLLFCLEILLECYKLLDPKEIIFDIYGPIEDLKYWNTCQDFIKFNNLNVLYKGALSAGDVQKTLANYDLLFLPTLGENYGQVIAESLSVGTPVLISNNTPWKNLQKNNLGWDIDLSDKSSFVKSINFILSQSIIDKENQRKEILVWSSLNLINSQNFKEYIKLFQKVGKNENS